MTVQLLALTQAGKVVVLPREDLSRVAPTARKMVEHGEWRTWDAFEAPDEEGQPRKLVASHRPGGKTAGR